ncbi:MAG: DUF1439 domain-containing protein [Planctomycetota bacterium]|nr:DUF1439 domain-containing protein [Planctomycetota bacterium]
MKKIVLVIVAVVVLAVAGAAAYFLLGGSVKIRITQAEIQAEMDKTFPISKEHLLVLKVEFSNPKVTLAKDANRITIGLDATESLNLPIGGKSERGSAAVSGSVGYDSAKGEFYLDDARIEKLDLPRVADKYDKIAQEIGSVALRECLNRRTIYKLDQKDYRQSIAKMVLKGIAVENEALVITVGIAQ